MQQSNIKFKRPNIPIPEEFRNLHSVKNDNNFKTTLFETIKNFVFEYLNGGSIHGIIFLSKIGLHALERYFIFINNLQKTKNCKII